MERFPRAGSDAGFTLIEMLIVILIIGILTALALPQYFKVVERDKVTEAVDVFLAVNGAQTRYNSKYGTYCVGGTSCPGFDYAMPVLSYFTVNNLAIGNTGLAATSWMLTLTRNGGPSYYGTNYSLTYDVEPNLPPTLSCSQSSCENDLLPSS